MKSMSHRAAGLDRFGLILVIAAPVPLLVLALHIMFNVVDSTQAGPQMSLGSIEGPRVAESSYRPHK